tara:strand:- start:625 stop:783 length:159 start_codon:yes stop_codon:yes gene_type:complete
MKKSRSLNQFFNDFVKEKELEEREWFEKQGIDYDEYKSLGEKLLKERNEKLA